MASIVDDTSPPPLLPPLLQLAAVDAAHTAAAIVVANISHSQRAAHSTTTRGTSKRAIAAAAAAAYYSKKLNSHARQRTSIARISLPCFCARAHLHLRNSRLVNARARVERQCVNCPSDGHSRDIIKRNFRSSTTIMRARKRARAFDRLQRLCLRAIARARCELRYRRPAAGLIASARLVTRACALESRRYDNKREVQRAAARKTAIKIKLFSRAPISIRSALRRRRWRSLPCRRRKRRLGERRASRRAARARARANGRTSLVRRAPLILRRLRSLAHLRARSLTRASTLSTVARWLVRRRRRRRRRLRSRRPRRCHR